MKEYIRFTHNRGDPRDLIVEDTLCNQITSWIITSASSSPVMFERQGIEWHILESLPTNTKIVVCVSICTTLFGRLVMKSMEKTTYAFVGMEKGWCSTKLLPTNYSSSLINQAGSTVFVHLFIQIGTEIFPTDCILRFLSCQVPCKRVIIVFLQKFHPKSLNLGYIQNVFFVEELFWLRSVT